MIVGVATVAFRVGLLRLFTYQEGIDPAGYIELSKRASGLLGASSYGGLYTFQPPIYPLTVTLYQVLGASTIDQYRVRGVAIGLALFLAMIALTQRLFSNRVALTAGIISAVSINLINGDLNLYPETLASLWLILCIWSMATWLDTRKWRWALAAGSTSGMAALTRGELVMLIPISIGVVLVTHRKTIFGGETGSRFCAALPAVAVAAAAIAVMIPWWATTAHLTGSPVLTTTGGGAHITYGACPDTFYRNDFAYSSLICLFPRADYFSREELDAAGVTSDNTQALDPAGPSFIREHLSDYPAVMAGRLGRSLGLYSPGDQAERTKSYGEAPAGVGVWVWLEWVALCLLAIPGAAVLWHRSRTRLLLLGCYIAPSLVGIAVGVGYTRYRTVFLPLIVMLAAAGLTSALSKRKVSRNVGVGMLALGTMFLAGRVAEAANVDPIHPTEPPTSLASEFGLGAGKNPDVVIGPISPADRPLVSNYLDLPVRRINVGTEASAQIVDVATACADRVGVYRLQSESKGGVIVDFRSNADHTIIRPTGPYTGWEVVQVRDGTESVLTSSAAPNRSGWVTVESIDKRVVLYQQGTPLIWFDTDGPITNVGTESTVTIGAKGTRTGTEPCTTPG